MSSANHTWEAKLWAYGLEDYIWFRWDTLQDIEIGEGTDDGFDTKFLEGFGFSRWTEQKGYVKVCPVGMLEDTWEGRASDVAWKYRDRVWDVSILEHIKYGQTWSTDEEYFNGHW